MTHRDPPFSDAQRFAIAGLVLLGLAALFLWRDLAIAPAWLVAGAAVLVTAAAVARWPFAEAGPVGLMALALGGGAWYAVDHDGHLLWGLGLVLLGAVTQAALAAAPRGRDDAATHGLAWYALFVSAWVASAVFYFHFLTLGLAEDAIGRRVLLTLVWMAAGITLVILGRRRAAPFRNAGQALLLVALVKALLYDTTHLGGGLRVGVLAGGGLLLLAGAALSARRGEG